jgi:hypothetical protein
MIFMLPAAAFHSIVLCGTCTAEKPMSFELRALTTLAFGF